MTNYAISTKTTPPQISRNSERYLHRYSQLVALKRAGLLVMR